jgi:hypothetical protein
MKTLQLFPLIVNVAALLCGQSGMTSNELAPRTVMLEKEIGAGDQTLRMTLQRRPFERSFAAAGKEWKVPGVLYFVEVVGADAQPRRIWQMARRDAEPGLADIGEFRMQADEVGKRILLAYRFGSNIFTHEIDPSKAVIPLEEQGPESLGGEGLPSAAPATNEIRVYDSLSEEEQIRLAVDPPQVRAIARVAGQWTVTVSVVGRELTFRWENNNTQWKPAAAAPSRPQ